MLDFILAVIRIVFVACCSFFVVSIILDILDG